MAPVPFIFSSILNPSINQNKGISVLELTWVSLKNCYHTNTLPNRWAEPSRESRSRSKSRLCQCLGKTYNQCLITNNNLNFREPPTFDQSFFFALETLEWKQFFCLQTYLQNYSFWRIDTRPFRIRNLVHGWIKSVLKWFITLRVWLGIRISPFRLILIRGGK